MTVTTARRPFVDRATLLLGDITPQQIHVMTRSGELHRIRRGRYAPGERWVGATDQERHRIRAAEIGAEMAGRAVISHESAAVLLGLQLPNGQLPRVHVAWPGSPGRRTTANITPHRGRLDPADVVEVDGAAITSPARTVFDVARLGVWERAVPVADSALRLGLCSAVDFVDVLDRHQRVPGAFRARRVFEFADSGAESVGESICRLRMAQLGLPAPTLQSLIPEISASPGIRVDFEFQRHRTVAEFDGRIKYGRLLTPGQAPGDVVFAEKVREDRIRDTGRECVRLIWADLAAGPALMARFLAAFRRAGFPTWEPEPARFLDPAARVRRS